MKTRIRRAIKQLLAFIPTRLPFGMTEYDVWAADIIFTYNLPDNDSSRFMLATMIQHCGAQEAYKAKRFFGLSSLKAGANQVAAGIMVELKEKRKAADLAAAEEARLQAALEPKAV